MSEFVRSFGTSVRHFRETRGWSQEMLAEKADLNRSYLGEVERGEVSPSLETALKISMAFGFRLSELLAYAEEEPV
jgi:XRE family transcriptional regulator, regulator of sulfur utilization